MAGHAKPRSRLASRDGAERRTAAASIAAAPEAGCLLHPGLAKSKKPSARNGNAGSRLPIDEHL